MKDGTADMTTSLSAVPNIERTKMQTGYHRFRVWLCKHGRNKLSTEEYQDFTFSSELLRNADLSIFNPDGLKFTAIPTTRITGLKVWVVARTHILKIDFPQGEQEIIKGHVTILQ